MAASDQTTVAAEASWPVVAVAVALVEAEPADVAVEAAAAAVTAAVGTSALASVVCLVAVDRTSAVDRRHQRILAAVEETAAVVEVD
jgi:hypothetical protein